MHLLVPFLFDVTSLHSPSFHRNDFFTRISEIWGLKQYTEVERFLLKFCKEVLNLPYNAPNIAVYGETGTFLRLSIIIVEKTVATDLQ